MVTPDSPFFSVRAQNINSKVAPGMEAQFTVLFRPTVSKDYVHDITFCTDREIFTIPVRALGARPELQLPEVIEFGGMCPCNSASIKSVLARNSGRCAGTFHLSATPPFNVLPSQASLDVGETVQCLVKFTPVRTGTVCGNLLVASPSGVEHMVTLTGTAVNVDVTVSPTEVSFVNTFVTKTTQRGFQIVNNTSQPIKFSLHSRAIQGPSSCSLGKEPCISTVTTAWNFQEAPDFGTPEMSAFPMSGLVLPMSYIEVLHSGMSWRGWQSAR